MLWIVVSIVLLQFSSSDCKSWTVGLTITVPGNHENDCYFIENIIEGNYVSIDFQVIRSVGNVDSSGWNKVEMSLLPPDPDAILNIVQPQSSGHINVNAVFGGDYKLCFKDPFSTSRGKVVFVSVMVEDPKDSEGNEIDRLNRAIADAKLRNDEERVRRYEFELDRLMSTNYKEITYTTKYLKSNLWSIERFQQLISAVARRDFDHSVGMDQRVTFWSTIYLFLIVICSIGQVAMVKSLFEEKHFLHRLLIKRK